MMNKPDNIAHRVIFLRHGESTSNNENTWGSWTDVDLSSQGIEEAKLAGNLLKDWEFDNVYTSIFKRTIKTWNIVADIIDHHHIPIYKSWRLNEKHYGALIGLNKVEISKKYGEEQVKKWRRDYYSKPPALEKDDPRNPAFDPLYKDIPKDLLPLTEVKILIFHFYSNWISWGIIVLNN
jgi:2,3-bisphosphoglycerate-dependent phosphoglycerate mutase